MFSSCFFVQRLLQQRALNKKLKIKCLEGLVCKTFQEARYLRKLALAHLVFRALSDRLKNFTP